MSIPANSHTASAFSHKLNINNKIPRTNHRRISSPQMKARAWLRAELRKCARAAPQPQLNSPRCLRQSETLLLPRRRKDVSRPTDFGLWCIDFMIAVGLMEETERIFSCKFALFEQRRKSTHCGWILDFDGLV